MALEVQETFVEVQNPHGRPLLIRPSEVAVIDGATDAHDRTGELWGHNPTLPYRRVILRGGTVLYVADSPRLLDQLTDRSTDRRSHDPTNPRPELHPTD